MQAYMVRREQDFRRLEEVLPEAKTPGTYTGHDAFGLRRTGWQRAAERLEHCSSLEDPVPELLRKASATAGLPPMRPRFGLPEREEPGGYALALDAEFEDGTNEDGDAFYEDSNNTIEIDVALASGYSDDDVLEAMVQEYDVSEDQELAEAFSTILHRKKNGSGKGNPNNQGSLP